MRVCPYVLLLCIEICSAVLFGSPPGAGGSEGLSHRILFSHLCAPPEISQLFSLLRNEVFDAVELAIRTSYWNTRDSLARRKFLQYFHVEDDAAKRTVRTRFQNIRTEMNRHPLDPQGIVIACREPVGAEQCLEPMFEGDQIVQVLYTNSRNGVITLVSEFLYLW